MKANEMLSVVLKALGILLLICSLGILANGIVSIIADLSAEYKARTAITIMHFFANFIYLIGAIAMIVGSKFVAKNIDKIEVKDSKAE